MRPLSQITSRRNRFLGGENNHFIATLKSWFVSVLQAKFNCKVRNGSCSIVKTKHTRTVWGEGSSAAALTASRLLYLDGSSLLYTALEGLQTGGMYPFHPQWGRDFSSHGQLHRIHDIHMQTNTVESQWIPPAGSHHTTELSGHLHRQSTWGRESWVSVCAGSMWNYHQ